MLNKSNEQQLNPDYWNNYHAFSRRCFALGHKLDLDVWDSDVDELWDIGAQERTDAELGEMLREIHLR